MWFLQSIFGTAVLFAAVHIWHGTVEWFGCTLELLLFLVYCSLELLCTAVWYVAVQILLLCDVSIFGTAVRACGFCSPYLVLLHLGGGSIFGTAGWFIAVHIWYGCVVRGSSDLVLLGVSGQSIFGSARWFGGLQSIFGLPGGLVLPIFGTGGWFGAVHNLRCQVGRCSPYLVLLGGSVQSIFGTAGRFGAVHIWYCQVVCCSPCLVLPGDLVQPLLGNLVAGHILEDCCVVCVAVQ
jgi:hypothetical protein